MIAQHPDRVGVVHQHAGAVLVRNFDDRGKVRDVALHREHTIRRDQNTAARIHVPLEHAAQCTHVVVRIAGHFGAGKQRAIDQAGVVQLVLDDGAVPPQQRGEDAEVGLIAGAEDQRGFLAHVRRQPIFQLLVQIEGAVQKAASRAAGAIAVEGNLGALEDIRMMSQAEIVVRADHDLALAPDHHLGVERFFDRLKIGVGSALHRIARRGEALTLVEKVSRLPNRDLRLRLRCSHQSHPWREYQ